MSKLSEIGRMFVTKIEYCALVIQKLEEVIMKNMRMGILKERSLVRKRWAEYFERQYSVSALLMTEYQ